MSGTEKTALAECLQRSGKEIMRTWTRAVEAIVVDAGATEHTHRLVSQTRDDGWRAWLVPRDETVTPEPRYPMVEMRRDGLTYRIDIIPSAGVCPETAVREGEKR